MAGSTMGTIFKITTWGESHGLGMGVVIDGCPAGISLEESHIQHYLDRRKPGQSTFSSPRKEADKVSILSGTFEGVTTGTPISLIIENTAHNSSDYHEISSCYRPGHADYTFDEKYGFRDYRGGGRSSGRETIGRVAAGAIALKILAELGIDIHAHIKSIGIFSSDHPDFYKNSQAYLLECKENSDSAGGVIECIVNNLPTGIGEPVFDKLDASLAKSIISIGAVKAFEVGDGCQVATSKGSTNNDSFLCKDGKVRKSTNHSGGILGGISDGSPVIIRAYFKPTPSIFTEQETINKSKENISIKIKGRHDPIIVPRAVVVVESMTALTIVDLILENMSSRMDRIKKFYSNPS